MVIKKVLSEKREIVFYLFFGVMTTIVNFSALWVFNILFGINEIIANSLAWVVAVTFAFVVNKYFVFQEKNTGILLIIKEAVPFYAGRFLTLIIDNLFIFVFVSKMGFNLFFIKVITEVIIIILNYIFGKFIFSNKKVL